MLLMRRRLRTGLCAAAVLPLLVLALSAPLNAMRCRFTGQVITACCCPPADGDQPASIGAGDCCERTRIDALRTASEPPSAQVRLAVPVTPVRTIVADDAAPVASPSAGTRARDGTIARPPLILIKRSFLI
jgi:hypothetical protein